MKNKITTISMTFDEFEEIKDYCKSNRRALSGFLVKLALDRIKGENK